MSEPDYRSLLEQLEQAKAQIAKLEAENTQVKAENTQVKAENTQVKAENAQVRAKHLVAELCGLEETMLPSLTDTSFKERSSLKAMKLSNISAKVSLEHVLAEFSPHPQEEDICTAVLASMQNELRPAGKSKEIKVVHPFIEKTIHAIKDAANDRNVPSLEWFHESRGAENQGIPDFSLTLPYERQHINSNTATVIEAKPYERQHKSHDLILREAVKDCLRYLGMRQKRLGYSPTRGIALAIVGGETPTLMIVRVDFSAPDIPVSVSNELVLLPPHSPSSSSSASTVPDGLRALVRILLTQFLEPFGLAALSLSSSLPFDFADTAHEVQEMSTLGEGGFATVFFLRFRDPIGPTAGAVMHSCVCKMLRRSSVIGAPSVRSPHTLRNEALTLFELERELVPFVPRVVQLPNTQRSIETTAAATATAVEEVPGIYTHGRRECLLLQPVGAENLISVEAKTDNIIRFGFAAKALCCIWAALEGAHAAGYLHGDVRPANLVRIEASSFSLSSENQDEVLLIDWGLSEKKENPKKRAFNEMVGQRAFFSDRRLLVLERKQTWTPITDDDYEAAGWTFFALACGCSLWPDDEFLMSPEDMRVSRREWVKANQDVLRGAANFVADSRLKEQMLALIDKSLIEQNPEQEQAQEKEQTGVVTTRATRRGKSKKKKN